MGDVLRAVHRRAPKKRAEEPRGHWSPARASAAVLGGTALIGGGLYAAKRLVELYSPESPKSGPQKEERAKRVSRMVHDGRESPLNGGVQETQPLTKVESKKAADYGCILPNKPLGNSEYEIRQRVLLETLAAFENADGKYHALAQGNLEGWAKDASKITPGACVVQVLSGDWGDVTLSMTKRYGTCFAALNMANADFPGGGYTKGMVAQEENMFRRTDCHFSLDRRTLQPGFERYNKDHSDLLNARNGRVYLDTSPRACIRGREQRHEDLGYAWLEDTEVFPFFELRAAAIDLRQINGKDQKVYDHAETQRRVAAQFETLRAASVRHVVLSAFGCGAFENPAGEVAKAYREALAARHQHFDVVVFAIFDAGYGPNNFGPFDDAFRDWNATQGAGGKHPVLYTSEDEPLRLLAKVVGWNSHVWDATWNGQPAVAKAMGVKERGILKKVQDKPWVVRVLYETPVAEYAFREGEHPKDLSATLVAMEKLQPANMHPSWQLGLEDLIDTSHSRSSRGDAKFQVHDPSARTRRMLLELLEAVAALSEVGLLWGDLKQENLGIDASGRLRIFDFGETSQISEDKRWMDIVAFGKLAYNVLARKMAFQPGRHYRTHRDSLTTAELVDTVDLLPAEKAAMDALRACFGLSDKSSSAELQRAVGLLRAMCA